MHHLEQDKIRDKTREKIREIPKANYQLSIFGGHDPKFEVLKAMLDGIDINTLSPVEALLKLNEIKLTLGKK